MQVHDLGQASRRRALVLLVLLFILALLIVGVVGEGLRRAVTDGAGPAGVGVLVAVLVGVPVVVALSRHARHRADVVTDATRLEQAAAAPLLARVPALEDATTLPALQPGAQAADPFRNLARWWEAEAARGPVGPVVVAAVASGAVRPARSGGSGRLGRTARGARAVGSPGPGGRGALTGRAGPPRTAAAAATDAWWAANLAIALAATGRSTLLVDGRIGDRFGATDQDAPDTPGLHDVLTGTPFELALSRGPARGLCVLPPGRVRTAPDPGLLATGFAAVVQEAARRFDAVVVLAPGFDQGLDAQTMAASGSLLLVVPEGRAGLSAVRSSTARVRTGGGRVAGVLMVERRRHVRSARGGGAW